LTFTTTKYQDVFGHTIELAEMNDKIMGITPAMPSGSSLKIYDGKNAKQGF
jgi:1-deoxy-D-xylulose-5-phosphate synthase